MIHIGSIIPDLIKVFAPGRTRPRNNQYILYALEGIGSIKTWT